MSGSGFELGTLQSEVRRHNHFANFILCQKCEIRTLVMYVFAKFSKAKYIITN